MSRSYKKYPVIYYEGKEDTKYMNRQLRRIKGEVPKGNNPATLFMASLSLDKKGCN